MSNLDISSLRALNNKLDLSKVQVTLSLADLLEAISDPSTQKTISVEVPDEVDDPMSPDEPEPSKDDEFSPDPSWLSNRKILYRDDFQQREIASFWKQDVPRRPGACEIVEAPDGRRSLRFDLRFSDELIHNNYRNEVVIRDDAKMGAERWYLCDFFIPDIPDPNLETIIQWHSIPDKSRGETWAGRGGPPLTVRHQNNKLLILNRYSDDPITNRRFRQEELLWKGSDLAGRWQSWVFHIKWSWQDDGLLEFFRNGRKVVSKKGPNCDNDLAAPYLKTGIYKYSWKRKNPAIKKRQIYLSKFMCCK